MWYGDAFSENRKEGSAKFVIPLFIRAFIIAVRFVGCFPKAYEQLEAITWRT